MFVATCAFRIDTGDVDTDLDDGFGQIVGIELGFGNFHFLKVPFAVAMTFLPMKVMEPGGAFLCRFRRVGLCWEWTGLARRGGYMRVRRFFSAFRTVSFKADYWF